ncbi:MAG TPA: fibronectin type III domain-containing protein [Bryobacteraceae bacterium]|nr:fibronectin type III domain-containing protein [Bryobacteraceae bacterium]
MTCARTGLLSLILASVCSAGSITVTLNESVPVNSAPMKMGVTVSTSSNYDSGQLFKNLLFTVNPGFEGYIQQEIVGCLSGSSTSCLSYNQYDQAPANYWAGASAWFCCSATGSNTNFGLTANVASSTVAAGSAGPAFTFSAALPQPIAVDDYFSVLKQVDSTGAGIPAWTLSGGAAGETTNLPPGSAGVQALALPSGACASNTIDTAGTHDFIILETGQTFGFNLKTIAVTGSPVLTVSIVRTGGVGGGVTPSVLTMTPGSAWAGQSVTFNGNEAPGTTYGTLQIRICSSGGTAYVDDADFERTSNLNAANATVYRDEVVASLAAMKPGSLRLWDYQLGETLADWTNPLFGRHVQASLQNLTYVTATSQGGFGISTAQGIMDFLGLCELLGVKPWLTIPVSWPVADYSNLIDFLSGGAETVYGAKRIANGHAASYLSTLGTVYVEFGNEPWNSKFAGINMPNFSYATTTNGMLSYAKWSNTAMAAMKANPNYSAALQLVINMQADNTFEYTEVIAPNNSHFDAISIAPYIGNGKLDSAGSLTAEWNPDTAVAYGDSNDTSGESGNGRTWAYVNAGIKPVYIYEDNENQFDGTADMAIVQNHNAAFMSGTVVAQQMLEHLKLLGPNAPQNLWSLAQDSYGNASGFRVPLYGVMKEAGGEWTGTGKYVQRPQALAIQIANESMIGPEYSSTVTGADTYSTAASNDSAAESNVPYEFAYCFMNGINRSCVLVNNDPVQSHDFTLTGTNAPATVTTRVLSMTSGTIDSCNNESALPCVSVVTTYGIPVTGGIITVPPGTIEGVDFIAGGGTPPVISGVTVTGITANSAVITWTTDQPSTSEVEFGGTPAYGSIVDSGSSLVTSHSVTLTGLTPLATYNFAVLSADTGGAAASANFTFSTLLPIPSISAVAVTGITGTSATVTWVTDQLSSSQVEYGTTPAYGSLSTLTSLPSLIHSVTLTGLNPATAYNFAVLSGDLTGTATGTNTLFGTLATIPGITAVTATNITGTSVTITWNTDQAANSQVEYGPTVSYGSLTTINSALVTGHSVNITGLSPGTTYNYAVLSTDLAGTATSANFTFQTPMAIPAISAVAATGLTANGATITWATDQPSTSQVEYGLTMAYGTLSTHSASPVTAHSVVLNSLAPGTTYDFATLSTDSAGTATSANFTFTTPVSLPLISAVTAGSITTTSATITWTTDQPSSSQVEYGLTTSYGALSGLNSSLVTAHSITLTGLTPGATWNLAALSTDAAGTASSANFALTTPPSVPVISGISTTSISTTSAIIVWTTDQLASSQVEYGTTGAYGSLSTLNASLVTSHSVTLTGLTPGVLYNYAAISANSAGGVTSANFTFTTPLVTANISPVGGARNNTGGSTTPVSLTIPYASSSGNTVVAVCALGSTASAINSITDSGSVWSLQAAINNGAAVRSEIWSTPAGGSVASSSFTIAFSSGAPASCAFEEYSGVLSIGAPASNQAVSGTASIGLAIPEGHDYVVAGLGENSYFGYTLTSGNLRQTAGLTSNAGNNYVEMILCDNTAAATGTVGCSSVSGPAPWAAVALTLRSVTPGGGMGPLITGVTSGNVTATSAAITWATDQPSNSQVEYGTTVSYGSLSTLNATPVTAHTVTLNGLTPGTTYDYAVISGDAGGNSASANFTFATPVLAAPVISAVAANGIGTSAATITWTTDQPSSTQVEYGTTSAYGLTSTLSSTPVTAHSVSLTGLTPGTTYNYAVISADAAGGSTSANFTFATAVPVPSITAVTASGVTSASATITWTTDQPSSTQVEFGTSTGYGSLSTLDSTAVTTHSATLTGLAPGVAYDYAVKSTDTAGTATSANFTFATAATIPAISAVSAGAITFTTATITWTTDQPSTSQVKYGPTNTYGSISALNSLPVTSHSVTLSGLASGATYNFEVISGDSAGSATSANSTFATPVAPLTSTITRVGGAHNNTGGSTSPASISIPYASSNGNTIVAVCSLGSAAASIGGITDGGSVWNLQAAVVNGTAVRSEIWSTPPGASVASPSFSIAIAGSGAPVSCALEEYAGVLSLGATATGQAVSGTVSAGLTTQDTNNFLVAGLGANSYNGYSPTNGVLRQFGGLTSNPGNNYVEMTLCDNTAATASAISCSSVSGPAPWAAVGLELRSTGGGLIPLPVISAVGSSSVTANTATIAWTTDQPSSSQVKYGLTMAYGSASPLSSSPVTAHSVTLSGLAAGTTYNYEVLSANSGGTSTSANFTFTTPATVPVISAVTSSLVTATSATITWTTDQPSSTQTEYGTTTSYGSLSTSDASPVTAHSVTLAGLTAGTTYDYAAISGNTAGTATSGNFVFSTPLPAPVISAVSASGVTGTSATVNWTTDQLSTSRVEYGTTAAYGSLSALNSSPVTAHSVTLTGLVPGTTWDYAVQSGDSGGVTTSANFTFATPATVPAISAVTVSSVSTTSATVTWTTDQPANSQVEYGLTTAYGSLITLDASAVTAHSETLTGLTAGKTYNYAVISGDSAGIATSANFTFTTRLVLTPVTVVGGAANNTGGSSAPANLTISYSSTGGNTLVAVCALGSTASSISSIVDAGSVWSLQAAANNGTAVRSEIWSTPAGGAVASRSFTISFAAGSPASCAIEEYAGVIGIGTTAANHATSGTISVGLSTDEANDYVVAGLGANSYNNYNPTGGTLRQRGGLTSNPGGNYVEMALCDNTAAAAGTVSCSSVSGPAAWAAIALELR